MQLDSKTTLVPRSLFHVLRTQLLRYQSCAAWREADLLQCVIGCKCLRKVRSARIADPVVFESELRRTDEQAGRRGFLEHPRPHQRSHCAT